MAEASVPSGYASTVSGSASAGYTITNSHTPETTSVSVTKAWVGPAGTSATFALYADNVDTGMTLTLSTDTGWSGSFENLAKYKNGEEIAYTVSETGMGGVSSSNYSTTSSGSASEGYTFTNTNTETVDVSGSKVWDDNDDQDGLRPGSVTVNLLRDGSVAATTAATADSDWSFSFDDLAKYDSTDGHEYTYAVAEATVPDGYTSSVSGYTITNTHTPETTSVSVSKVWSDASNQDGKRPDSVTVQLYANGETSGDAVTLSSDGWSYTWSGLDKYAGGEEINYTVEETEVPDGYAASYSGDASAGFTITNTHTPETTSVSVTKAWDDSDDQDGLRPDSVSVQLYAGGTASGSAVELNDDNNWTYTWSGLDKYSGGQKVAYTVAEASVPSGYTSTVSGDASSGFTITNSHDPETTSVSVSKAWVGPAGGSATFELYAGGSATGQTLTLTADDSWSGSFDGLAKYKNGTEIAYTVSETGMGGVSSSNYSTTVSGDASSGYVFTNTNTETVTMHVQIYWQPSWQGEASVVVELYSDGVATGSKLTLVRDENDTVNYGWNGDFSDLPKYDSNGVEIEYTVVEEAIYWADGKNYREYYGCTPSYTTSGNTITCALWNEFGGGDG